MLLRSGLASGRRRTAGRFSHRFLFLLRSTLFIGLAVTSAAAFTVVPKEDGKAADIASAQKVILWYRNYDSPAIRALLDLALRKTPEYGPYFIARSQEMNQGRALRELSNDNGRAVQVANVATTPEREDNLLAVTIPIDGGLLGYRVCVTTPEQLSRFEGITRLADVRAKNIRFGQGRHWPDTQILEANGLKVVTHTQYESLFGMLKGGRFECFARGVSEVVYDLDLRQDGGLVIEPDLLFTYTMPSYFFVGRNDMALAMRIQLGLERAIVDGSFLKYLAHYFTRPLQELQLSTRRVFQLGNPWLPGGEKGISEDVLHHMKVRIQLGDRTPPPPN